MDLPRLNSRPSDVPSFYSNFRKLLCHLVCFLKRQPGLGKLKTLIKVFWSTDLTSIDLWTKLGGWGFLSAGKESRYFSHNLKIIHNFYIFIMIFRSFQETFRFMQRSADESGYIDLLDWNNLLSSNSRISDIFITTNENGEEVRLMKVNFLHISHIYI